MSNVLISHFEIIQSIYILSSWLPEHRRMHKTLAQPSKNYFLRFFILHHYVYHLDS